MAKIEKIESTTNKIRTLKTQFRPLKLGFWKCLKHSNVKKIKFDTIDNAKKQISKTCISFRNQKQFSLHLQTRARLFSSVTFFEINS